MRIQHNIMAMNAYRNYTNNVSAMKKNLEKLSSGYKINRAGDDAAGLAISEKMRAQITGLQTAQKNAKDGISLVQTAEGALTEVHDMLNRMVELATQSANGTYDNTTDRYQLQKEVNQLLDEINRIADSSNFNGIKLLDGTLGLNTEAFTVGESVAYEAAGAAGTWAPTTAEINAAHGDDPTSGAVGEFKIDLSQLGSLQLATGKQGKVTLSIGTQKASVTLGKTTSTALQTITGTAIASAFDGETITIGAGASAKNFKITNASGVLTVKSTEVTASQMTADDVAAFKKLVGGAVDIKVTSSATTNIKAAPGSLTWNHAVEDVKDAVAQEDGGRIGMDFNIKNLIADGNTLTIDGKTYTFHIGSDATTANTATMTDIYVDTTKFDGTAAVTREVMRLLSNKDTTNFDIETKDADNGLLHIDAKKTSKVTKDEMTAGVKGSIKGDDAVNAGTQLDVKAANIKEGNILTIGEGSKAIKVKFEKTDTTDAAVLARIEEALGTSGYTVEKLAADAGTDALKGLATGATRFIIHSANADATNSPRILGKGLTLQIGDTSDDFNQLNVAVQDCHTTSLGINKLDISTEEAAQQAIQKIKDAINTVSDVRGTLGATQNRLDHTINNLSVMTENIQDAESTIRDTDVAEEMMAYTKNNILIQSAQAMLAQANQVPQGVLQLLG